MGARGKPKTPGSGRQKGGLNKATRLRLQGLTEGESPLDYMLRRMRDPSVDPEIRDRMAIAVAPYCHPRLSAMTNREGDGPAVVRIEQIERVIVDPLVAQAAQADEKVEKAAPEKDWYH